MKKRILCIMLLGALMLLSVGLAEDAAEMPDAYKEQAVAIACSFLGMELTDESVFQSVSIIGNSNLETCWSPLRSTNEQPICHFTFDASGRLTDVTVIDSSASDVDLSAYDGEDAVARIGEVLKNASTVSDAEAPQIVSNLKYMALGDMEKVHVRKSDEGAQWVYIIVTGPGECYFDNCVIEVHINLTTESVSGIYFTYLD